MNTIYDALLWVVPLVIAITFHEAAHGFAASRLGDDTALRQGRVTFNPLKHIDPLGTIILPALLFLFGAQFLFGYAKPVPVSFERLNNPRRDTALVALAGPGTNLVLALFSALLLHLDMWVTPEDSPWLFETLYKSVSINAVIAVFNMIPLLPLDGGRVLGSLLPPSWFAHYRRTERWGMLLVLVVFVLPPLLATITGHQIDMSVLYQAVGLPVAFLIKWVLYLTGNGLAF